MRDDVYKVTKDGIFGFFKDHRFLSNFYLCPIFYNGDYYQSNEHAYQAAKTHDPDEKRGIKNAATPNDARKLGSKCTIREDWETVKFQVMEDVNRLKFADPELRKMLLETGDKYLEETNWWCDKVWGTFKGEGQNNLGKILMKIRQEIRENRTIDEEVPQQS